MHLMEAWENKQIWVSKNCTHLKIGFQVVWIEDLWENPEVIVRQSMNLQAPSHLFTLSTFPEQALCIHTTNGTEYSVLKKGYTNAVS